MAQIARHAPAEVRHEVTALTRVVQERRFTVAILGEFKRGKSTFINALLGKEVLPADIAPTTACINRIVYGLRPSATLHFRDGRPPAEIEVSELSENITKLTERSKERAASLKEAVVAWPIAFCRNDVDLVDTPGLSDELAMSRVTRDLLPEVDAAIFVVMATSPFSESEGEFLSEMLQYDPGKVIFVVTGMDRIRRERDRSRVLESVRERVERRLATAAAERHPDAPEAQAQLLARLGRPKVFGLSGLDALEARLARDEEALAASGMVEVEACLEELLGRSDAIGLHRRLRQVAGLSRGLLSEPQGPSGDSSPADVSVLVGLVGTLRRQLGRGLDEWKTLVRSRIAATPAELEALQRVLVETVNRRIEKERWQVAQVFSDGRIEEWSHALARDIWGTQLQTVVEFLMQRTDAVGRARLEGAELVRRLVITTNYILGVAHQELEGELTLVPYTPIWHKVPEDGLVEESTLGIHAMAQGLLPSSDEFAARLLSPTVQEVLSQTPQTDLLSQFSRAISGSGPGRDWKRAVVKELSDLVIDARRLERVYSSWVDQLALEMAQAIPEALERVRGIDVALEGLKQREQLLNERAQLERDQELAFLADVSARAEHLAQELQDL